MILSFLCINSVGQYGVLMTQDRLCEKIRTFPFGVGIVTDIGFIKGNLTIKTYTQKKQGLLFFYTKQKVILDGICTVPLDI